MGGHTNENQDDQNGEMVPKNFFPNNLCLFYFTIMFCLGSHPPSNTLYRLSATVSGLGE